MNTDQFRQYLLDEKRYSVHTVKAYISDIRQFFAFILQQYEMDNASLVTALHIRAWIVSLMDSGMTPRSVNRKLSSLRTYFGFLRRHEVVPANAFANITGPKTGRRLPEVVTKDQAADLESLLRNPADFAGKRDRILLLMLYNLGLRRSEMIEMRVADIDFERHVVEVRGKGRKMRLVPLSPLMEKELRKYLDARSEVGAKDEEQYVLLTDRLHKAYPKFVYNTVRKYLSLVTTNSRKSPHVLRHSFATHLSDEGADINAIKELLGHSSLAATQVYTHTSVQRLRKVYEQAHPKAKE